MIETSLSIAINHSVKSISGLLQVPTKANAMIVLAHGAGAGMQHPHMENLTTSLLDQAIACLRFQFPFMEQSRRRPDSLAVAVDSTLAAINTATQYQPSLPLFIGGHSFGGRVATHAAVNLAKQAGGLIAFSFPLHPAKKPSVKRAEHLASVPLPLLFINGDRDPLAEVDLLSATQQNLPNLDLHWLPGADHGYKTTKRSGITQQQTYLEAGRRTRQFIDHHTASIKF